jgi:hypothetical protein
MPHLAGAPVQTLLLLLQRQRVVCQLVWLLLLAAAAGTGLRAAGWLSGSGHAWHLQQHSSIRNRLVQHMLHRKQKGLGDAVCLLVCLRAAGWLSGSGHTWHLQQHSSMFYRTGRRDNEDSTAICHILTTALHNEACMA